MQAEQPVPYMLKGFHTVDMRISSPYTIFTFKPHAQLTIEEGAGGPGSRDVTILHSSLYRVASVEPANIFDEAKHIWGVELIDALRTKRLRSVHLTLEVTYF